MGMNKSDTFIEDGYCTGCLHFEVCSQKNAFLKLKKSIINTPFDLLCSNYKRNIRVVRKSYDPRSDPSLPL